jgi:hypothetical protein
MRPVPVSEKNFFTTPWVRFDGLSGRDSSRPYGMRPVPVSEKNFFITLCSPIERRIRFRAGRVPGVMNHAPTSTLASDHSTLASDYRRMIIADICLILESFPVSLFYKRSLV